MVIKNISKKIKRFPKGKYGELKNQIVTKDVLIKMINNQSEYIKKLQGFLNQKETLTENEIIEVENINRILENKKKYEAENNISKTGLNKNILKLNELNRIKNLMEEEDSKIYDPSKNINISDIEEII